MLNYGGIMKKIIYSALAILLSICVLVLVAADVNRGYGPGHHVEETNEHHEESTEHHDEGSDHH